MIISMTHRYHETWLASVNMEDMYEALLRKPPFVYYSYSSGGLQLKRNILRSFMTSSP